MKDIYIAQLINIFKFNTIDSLQQILNKNDEDNNEINNEINNNNKIIELDNDNYCEFSWNTKKKLNKNVIPYGVTDVFFGKRYNQIIEECVFPNTVECIIFHHSYNKPLKEGIFPLNLTYLSLGKKYNIKNAVIPESVVELIYYDTIEKNNVLYLVNRLSLNKMFVLTVYYPTFYRIEDVENIELDDDDIEEIYDDNTIYESYEEFEEKSYIYIKMNDVTLSKIPKTIFPTMSMLYDFIDKLYLYIENRVEQQIQNVAHPKMFEKLLNIKHKLYSSSKEDEWDSFIEH